MGLQASVRQRSSVTSATLKMQRTRTDGSNTRLRSNSNLTSGSLLDEEEVVHPVEPRARTAMLPPVMVSQLNRFHMGPQLREFPQTKKVDEHPLCWLGFEEDCIMTSCSNGECRDFLGGRARLVLISLSVGTLAKLGCRNTGFGVAERAPSDPC